MQTQPDDNQNMKEMDEEEKLNLEPTVSESENMESQNAHKESTSTGKSDTTKNLVDISEMMLEINDFKSKNLRLLADMDNLQKQHIFDTTAARTRGKQTVLEPVLTFLNTLNLSFGFTPMSEDTKVNAWINTLKSSYDKLLTDLTTYSVELIVPKIGDEFDPEIMQSLNQSEEDKPVVKNIISLGVKVDGKIVHVANVML